MGLDIGEKRIGVALSDPEEILASPLDVIFRYDDESAINRIGELVKFHDVGRLVIGIPRSLSGDQSEQTINTREFIDKISEVINLEIIREDERFSTVVAHRLLTEAGSRKRKNKGTIDAAAAAYILQGYLDKKRMQQ